MKSEESDTLFQSLRSLASIYSLKKITIKIPYAEAEWGIEKSLWRRLFKSASTGTRLTRLLDQSIYHPALNALGNIRIGDEFKVVVFIDDLDRCFPDKAIKLLESIKLILSQAGFIFVLGVSRSVIEGYLKLRYVKRYGLEEFHASKYLDKIVQLDFPLAPVRESKRIRTFLEKLFAAPSQKISPLQDLYKDCLGLTAELAAVIGSVHDYNPRASIRFLNRLITDKIIFDSQVQSGLIQQDTPFDSFIVTQILQQGWSSAYYILEESPTLSELIREDKLSTTPASSLSEKDQLVLAEYSNNKFFRELLESTAGKEWLRQREGRTRIKDFLRTLRVSPADLFLDIKTWRSEKYDAQFQGHRMYRWDATIQAQSEVLNAIESVIYRLHSSYPNPTREVIDRATNFKLKELAWGSSTLYADVKVRNQDEIITLSGSIKLNLEALRNDEGHSPAGL